MDKWGWNTGRRGAQQSVDKRASKSVIAYASELPSRTAASPRLAAPEPGHILHALILSWNSACQAQMRRGTSQRRRSTCSDVNIAGVRGLEAMRIRARGASANAGQVPLSFALALTLE